ncbi:MAG: hypothetical protein Q9174_000237 [Haloplaca sp. 1 TL-2023]
MHILAKFRVCDPQVHLSGQMRMSLMATPRIVEGVFAVNKPKSISSAQVLRDIQYAFNDSKIFKPWLDVERNRRDIESSRQRKRRRNKRLQVKLGHGGTLDPMATGVLVVGVGKGTKQLQDFLGCTKTYEATILFGAATDTYDVLGKVVSKAPYSQVNRDLVESALSRFRGPIEQRPPLYSALRMDGKRLYEYAREGKEAPREIAARPVTTESLEIREWLPSGSHEYKWPDKDVDVGEKIVAGYHASSPVVTEGDALSTHLLMTPGSQRGEKRPRQSEDEDAGLSSSTPPAKRHEMSTSTPISATIQDHSVQETEAPKSATDPEAYIPKPAEEPAPSHGPPAARLSMTVTSGFYVRSLCHDLGQAVNSLGMMCDLVRTRQSDFELGRNVIEYNVFSESEDVWGPQVWQMLIDWQKSLDENSANSS